jgi:endogenous inhibitor of DNA gyrase (YacG/DUF329 family)
LPANSSPPNLNHCTVAAKIQQICSLTQVFQHGFQCVNLSNVSQVKCPNCGRETEYQGNDFRPFCSERCKMLDLGAWIDGEYTLPVEGTEMTEDDIEQIETALNERNAE